MLATSLFAVLCFVGPASRAEADDSFVKRETWQETVSASRGSFTRLGLTGADEDTDKTLAARFARDYPVETDWITQDGCAQGYAAWFADAENTIVEKTLI